MAACLPVEPDKGNDEELVALVNAFPDTRDPKNWSADPEQACIRHHGFLTVFLKRHLQKQKVQKVFQGACKRLQASEARMIANCIMEVRKWTLRKWKNLKSGVRTTPAVLSLMHAVYGQPAQGKAEPVEGKAGPVQGIKRRLTVKSPPSKNLSPIIIQDSGEVELSPSSLVEEISSSAGSSLGKASSGCIGAEVLEGMERPSALKKPAAQKRPAAKRACKRPAADVGDGEAARACARPPIEMAASGAWHGSMSFSWVKPTKAAKKAYIQARNDAHSKPYCLVNVERERGHEQDRIMSALMHKAQHEQGLSKAQLVAFKNDLVSGTRNVD